MRTRLALLVLPAVALALVTTSACSKGTEAGGGGATRPAGQHAGHSVSIKVADSEFGRILVDQSGRTLYGFTRDKSSVSNCGTDCIAVWPALTSSTAARAGAGTEKSLLSKAKLTGDVSQVTYGDWPLYYYVGDAVPGDINGQGLDGEWFVVTAQGKLMKTPAA
ncbi:COG4315 family predicted lipoprotein [Streptomyces sp. NBC_00271]|uniref:COG4315 family predicted lipoprotein n=1 Tax=Streptomyces sp. NBC_00271 TaxID=2975697 RepID=UPI003FA73F00